MSLDQQTVTLIAAGVAATAALVNAAVTIYFARRTNSETQYRDLLKSHMEELGVSLHQAVACCSVVVTRHRKRSSTKQWLERAHEACGHLKELHRKLRYPLGSVAEGLRDLARLSSWIDHVKDDHRRADAMIAAGDGLRVTLDNAIRAAYLRGRPPNWWQRRSVASGSRTLRRVWEQVPGAVSPDELEELDATPDP